MSASPCHHAMRPACHPAPAQQDARTPVQVAQGDRRPTPAANPAARRILPISKASPDLVRIEDHALVTLAIKLGLGQRFDDNRQGRGGRRLRYWLFTRAEAEAVRRHRIEHGSRVYGGSELSRREQRALSYAAVLESEGWAPEAALERARAAYDLGSAHRPGGELRLSAEWRRACREHVANSRGAADNYPLGEVR